MKVEYLPGEITDPNWSGVRCQVCGRPMGGDQTYEGWATCDDVPQAHTTFDSIPPERARQFFLERVWNNALSELGLHDAIEWMAAGPLSRVDEGHGFSVLNEQLTEWPNLARQLQAIRSFPR